MSFPKMIFTGGFILFLLIGAAALYKKWDFKKNPEEKPISVVEEKEEAAIPLLPIAIPAPQPHGDSNPISHKLVPIYEEKNDKIDRIHQLFTTSSNKLPIVETISYTSRVSWLKGRPAWIADYASHFSTSRHFIARSLNGKADYLTQKVSPGDRFNVFRENKNFNFYLAIDLSRRKMWFYYIDLDTNERLLLKTYPVGLGRLDDRSPSGTLTPIGKYTLGSKIATYKPGVKGYFQDQEVEMIQVFGTRWLPFDREIGDCSAPAKGYGIHGAPWTPDPEKGGLIEKRDCIGAYVSDGCIKLYQEDIEEIFSIVITKPTFVEIVTDISQADLPGIEFEKKTDEFIKP